MILSIVTGEGGKVLTEPGQGVEPPEEGVEGVKLLLPRELLLLQEQLHNGERGS